MVSGTAPPVEAAPSPSRPPAGGRSSRRAVDRLHVDPVGLAVGTAFAMLAMTPSLLPRDWLFQGLVCGISAAAGYGAGTALAWPVRRSALGRRVAGRVADATPPWSGQAAWAALVALAALALTVMLLVAASWQRQVATLMSMEQPTTGGWLRAGPLLVAVAALIVAAARGVRWLARLAGRLLALLPVPRRLASAAGGVLAVALLVVVVDDVMLARALTVADTAFSGENAETFPGVTQPTEPTRSGSPASIVPWDTLGKEGRLFVAEGPTGEQLVAASDGPALEPVRVYVGVQSAPTPQERARLAVAELERAGAFDRAVLVVVTTTGRGWVNETAASALEIMYGGDTAIVATQYSYLPSWLSFIVDRTRAAEEGRLLFDAVSARVEELPAERRPRLLVYGESLGSQGSEHAFSTIADARAQADGVLWVGPPNSNRLWSALVARRDPGTPAVEPVYADGRVVRFAGDVADLAEPPTRWAPPRVLYLQHPSDPIVWWSPHLLFRRPDWLVEPRGDDVSPAMSWYPVVTFWQVTADLTNALSVPDGHGHRYGDLLPDAWAAVAGPDGWTAEQATQVRDLLVP